MNRREWLASLAAVPPAAAFVEREVFGSAIMPAQGTRSGYFPNVLLRTQDNKAVRFYDDLIRGKVVMINMFYTECNGLCPRMTENLKQVHEALGDRVGRDIFMYSITLKPEHDRPRNLKEYVSMHNIKPGWTFLTGASGDIEKLRRKLGFTDPDPKIDKDKSEHIGIIRYGNETLDRWAACPALTNPKEIVKYLLWMDSKATEARRS